MVDINEYNREVVCEYKGELYSVRDNGAVMRHARNGKKLRKLDNVWTFGTKDKTNGYMMINSHRVHIIVATAFISGNKDGKMVVDHIDTNRCNNRVENLRWLTRLENVLLNEATLKRVTFLCGGDINKFIENPSCLKDLTGNNKDILWMRTVTAEEAKLAWEHISSWAKRPISTFSITKKDNIKTFDEWLKAHPIENENQHSYLMNVNSIKTSNSFDECRAQWFASTKANNNIPLGFSQNNNEIQQKENFSDKISESLTARVLQTGFFERLHFPLCPKESICSLDEYAKKLAIGSVIALSEKGKKYTIKTIGWTSDWNAIQIEINHDSIEIYSYIHISIKDGCFLHSLTTYDDEFRFCDSPCVLQWGARGQCYFPLCPKDGNISLKEYANLLRKGAIIEKCSFGEYSVYDSEICKFENGTPILYVGVMNFNALKHYGDLVIYVEKGKVIHQIRNTYFDEISLQRNFCNLRGEEWDDSKRSSDDYVD